MPFLIRSRSARRVQRVAWQHVGLVSGFLAGRHFVGTKDLHYGYWLDDVEQIIRNLPRAQEDYCRFILEHIPDDAGRILDVGSGAGSVASQLVGRGQAVDCISPCSFLNSQARALLGDRARIFECKYEDFQSDETYDCILFCESFQYVNMQQSLEKVTSQLRRGGHLVICDFFRIPGADRSPISGGHPFEDFQQIISRFPLRQVEDINITARTAPTFTVIDSAFTQVLQPIWDEIDGAFASTHPAWYKMSSWLFGKRLAKVQKKYFTHERSAENFQKYKTYRLMRFERQ